MHFSCDNIHNPNIYGIKRIIASYLHFSNPFLPKFGEWGNDWLNQRFWQWQYNQSQASVLKRGKWYSFPYLQLRVWRLGEDDDAFRMELVTRDDWQSQSCYSDLMMHMMTIKMSPLCWPPWPLRIIARDGHTETLGIWRMTGQWPLTILSSQLVNTLTVIILVSVWWSPSSNNSFSENRRSWEQIFRMTLWTFELGMNKLLSFW